MNMRESVLKPIKLLCFRLLTNITCYRHHIHLESDSQIDRYVERVRIQGMNRVEPWMVKRRLGTLTIPVTSFVIVVVFTEMAVACVPQTRNTWTLGKHARW